MIVVDTNVLANALVPGEASSTVRRVFIRDPEWAAPPLARSELRNVLLGCVRRGELALEDAVAAMDGLVLALGDREFEVVSGPVLSLAVVSGCTAYDCEFVALAKRLGVRLVTFDRQVLKAFPRIAIAPEVFVAE